MTESVISRYPVPDINDLPEDIKATVLNIQEKSGFVPNVFLAMAHRPDEMRAFFSYHDALMERDGNLTKADKEMIVVVTSADNSCLYCVVAHGAILRIRAKSPTVSDQVATNYRKADITDRQKAMCAFALKVSNDAKSINDDDFVELRTHGFDDEDIWDIAGITSFFGLSNRMANFMSMMPNTEFFGMAR